MSSVAEVQKSNSLATVKDAAISWARSAGKARAEAREAPMRVAMQGLIWGQLGAAGNGGAKALLGVDNLYGIPIDLVGAGVLAAGGWFLESHEMIQAANGFLAPYTAQKTYQMLARTP